jgi:hypothetical protein
LYNLALLELLLFAGGVLLAAVAIAAGDYTDKGEAAGLSQDVLEVMLWGTLFIPFVVLPYHLVLAGLARRAPDERRLRRWAVAIPLTIGAVVAAGAAIAGEEIAGPVTVPLLLVPYALLARLPGQDVDHRTLRWAAIGVIAAYAIAIAATVGLPGEPA